MPDDVLLNKVATVERCLVRIRQEYAGHEEELEINLTKQDSIVLNLQRACEASIDLAMHLVRQRRLGLPQESRHAFVLLHEAGILSAGLSEQLQAMVGFRNVAVHNYQTPSIPIVRSILDHRLPDFEAFARIALTLERS